ncbi:SCO family protein [Amaricoccus solimangrovi]|uniref:SCO family protein n=1 Tax=Amaricoccus solimangrovi TaxID=2589815 RepID=A0A501WVR6_9RHOB|nr:SCO family protein [Amaricoccus solimangrovi]TPE51051.1 SCO family protein [Amaricoccus solimangrovi]
MIRLLALLLALAAPPAAAFDALRDATIDARPGATIPLDRPFRDESGRRVTLAELADGRPIVLAPVLHDCPNICDVSLAGLAQAIGGQSYRPGRDFALVAFGIDPKETPETAAASLDRLRGAFPGLGPITGLTGAAPDIAAVTEALGYRYAWDPDIGEYAHISAAAVLTPDGRLAAWLRGIAPEPADLRLALTDAGQGKLGSWGDQILLLCYHYDPKTGEYGSIVTTLLRAGGVATAGGGALLIGLALWRERRRRP